MRLLVPVGLGLLLLGCPSQLDCPNLLLPEHGKRSGPIEHVVGLAGEPLRVELFSPTVLDCKGRIRPPEHLEVAVSDPLNLPVATTEGLLPTDGTSVGAWIEFGPARAGAFHIALRFEPDLGSVQTLVNVAEDHRDGGHRVFDLDQDCTDVALAGSTVLCLSQGPRQVHTISGGQTTSSVDARSFVQSGDGTWVLDTAGFTLQHYELLDGGLRLLDQLDAGRFFESMTSLEGRALLLSTSELLEVSAGPQLEAWESLQNPIGDGPFLQWLPGVGAVVMARGPGVRVCVTRVTGTTLDDCRVELGEPLGANSDGAWFLGDGGLEVERLMPDGGALQLLKGVWPGKYVTSKSPQAPLEFTPVLLDGDAGVFIPRADPVTGGVVLEAYDPPDPSAALGADSDCLYTLDGHRLTCWNRR